MTFEDDPMSIDDELVSVDGQPVSIDDELMSAEDEAIRIDDERFEAEDDPRRRPRRTAMRRRSRAAVKSSCIARAMSTTRRMPTQRTSDCLIRLLPMRPGFCG